LSQPQQMRSGCMGWRGNFFAMGNAGLSAGNASQGTPPSRSVIDWNQERAGAERGATSGRGGRRLVPLGAFRNTYR
jgi:hypothetical protein